MLIGVKQGEVISPALFSLNIYELVKLIYKFKVHVMLVIYLRHFLSIHTTLSYLPQPDVA